MYEELWLKIKDYLSKNCRLSLLSHKGSDFDVIKITDEYIVIKFVISNNRLKLEKTRFISAYKLLNEKRNNWVLIGANRSGAKADTLEGRIKNDFDGKMNGISTAPWITSILTNLSENIVFNNKKRGQAIMLLDKSV